MERNNFRKSLGCIILCCIAAATFSSCVKLPRRAAFSREQATTDSSLPADATLRISLNRSTREELESLPGIGPALAARIIEHRERYGPFRRAEHLLLVRGISERRFRQLRPFINAE